MEKRKRTAISVWKHTCIRKRNWKASSMKYGRNLEAKPVGSQKRRLKTKPLLVVIGTLFVVNVLWFIGWLIPDKPVHSGGHEEVASVAGKPITKEQWMTAMEE